MKQYGTLAFGTRNWKIYATTDEGTGRVSAIKLVYGLISCHKAVAAACTTPLLIAALAVAEAGVVMAQGLIDTGDRA